MYEREVFANGGCRSPREAVELVRPHLERQEVEQFVVVLLNSQHVVIGVTKVTSGILNSSLVHPREVFRVAIAMGAAAIICAHNHPSGDPTPSTDDRAVTEQLVAAGRILDIPVHDHIIIAGSRYTSFAEAGLL
jgi:DNA repair protein RadC